MIFCFFEKNEFVLIFLIINNIKMVLTRSQKRQLDEETPKLINKKQKNENSESNENNESEENESEANEASEESENKSDSDMSYVSESTITEQIINVIKNKINKTIKKNNKKKDEDEYNKYDEFNYLLESIYDGSFFERIPIEDRKEYLKEKLNEDEIGIINAELYEIQENYKNSSPSIIDILKMNISTEQKKKLLEKLHCLVNSEILTNEYTLNLKYLNANTQSVNNNPELFKLEEEILKSNFYKDEESYRLKILKSKMSFENKIVAYKKLEIMETYEDSDTSEYAKYKSWMDSLLSVPFGIYTNIPVNITSNQNDINSYIKHVRNILDEKLSFLEKPKDQIINLVTQMIRNPDININAIGLYGNPGIGKCNGFNTPILMFDGIIKMVQDIEVGDLLMGDDSIPRKVLSLSRGKDIMYKITNVKGEQYIVNSEHILCLKYSNNKRIIDDKKSKRFRVKSFNNKDIKINTKDFYYNKKDINIILEEATEYLNNLKEDKICEISVKKYLQLSNSIKNKLKGYSVPIEFPERELPLDPYMIGFWLGVGTSSSCEITTQDSTIIKYFKTNLEQYKCYIQYHNNNTINNNYKYRINGDGSRKENSNHFMNILKKYNLIHNKHIPLIYKCNSRENRLKLLAGLLDADGNLQNSKSGYEFTQSLKHEQIIDDIIFLSRSLGFACYKNKKQTTWTYKGIAKYGEAWRINISGNGIEEIPVLCPRKKATKRKQIKDVLVSGITVEKLFEDNYYGFELDKNHRYVLGNFIVTHNSSIASSIAEALGRPFKMISLGGESDSSNLIGHNFTYIGSGCGSFMNSLIDSKTMNPVVLIDEIDKISQTNHGKEIIGTLIHLTDSTTNNKYNHDKYFSGIDFDLSKVLFVFTYNDSTKIDRILADRLIKINIDNYSFKEKIEITSKHIIKYILDKFNFNEQDIKFESDAIEYIINQSDKETGMRDIKTKIKIILSRINNLLLTNENDNIIKLKYKKLYSYYKNLPIIIPKHHINILLDESITDTYKSNIHEHMYL